MQRNFVHLSHTQMFLRYLNIVLSMQVIGGITMFIIRMVMLRGLLTLMKSYGQKQMKRVKASPDKLLKAYKSGLSVPEIALHYKVSRSTAWRWLKKLNIDLTRVKYNRTRKPDYGKMASWLRLHGDIVLPKSIKEICLISGLSNDVVRSYFNRRQHLQVIRVRKYLKELFASDTL